MHKLTLILMSSTKKQKSKIFQILLNLNCKTFCIFSVFEQLSSLIGWRVMAFSQTGLSYLLPELIFLSKFGFLSHNFRSRNAKNLIKGSNDLYYSLVSNETLNQKIVSLG